MTYKLFFSFSSGPKYLFKNSIHYTDQGKGKTIVLIHGASSNLHEFFASGLVQSLSQNYRVIAFDRPGLGRSERKSEVNKVSALERQVEILHEFLLSLKIEKPLLVGHSLGGAIAAGYLARYPKEVSGFVSLAGAISPVGSGESWYTSLAVKPVLGNFFRWFVLPVFGPLLLPAAVERNFSPDPVPEDYSSQAYLNMIFKASSFKNNAYDLNQIYSFHKKIYNEYEKIKIPVTLIYGKKDSVISSKLHTEMFMKKVPQSKLILLEDAGHLPHHGRVDLVLREIDILYKEKQLN